MKPIFIYRAFIVLLVITMTVFAYFQIQRIQQTPPAWSVAHTLSTKKADYTLFQVLSNRKCPNYKLMVVGDTADILDRPIQSCSGLVRMEFDKKQGQLMITVPSDDPTGLSFFYTYTLEGGKWVDDGRP